MKKNQKTIYIIVGLLLVLIPYIINIYSVYRLLTVLVGLVLIETGCIIDKTDKAWRIVVLPLIFIILAFVLDFGIAHIFKIIPIFSERVESSNEVVVYNSLFYREYSCNNKIIIDDFYEKKYQCSSEDLKEIDSTSFLNNVLENYNNHKNKFVKITGKVSKLNGTYNLEMQAYTLTDESINGYVLFSNNITLEVNFNQIEDLTKYNLYDSITVIGRIDELIKKGEYYTVRMYDSVILNSDLYDTYELSAVENKNCESDKEKYAETQEGVYYTSCLNNIYVKFNEENIYDLSYVLIDKKINKDELINKSIETKEENNNTLYDLGHFKMLICGNNKEIIFGSNTLELDSPYCEVKETNSEEL